MPKLPPWEPGESRVSNLLATIKELTPEEQLELIIEILADQQKEIEGLKARVRD